MKRLKKRKYNKIGALLLGGILAVITCFSFLSCKFSKPITKEDLIPKTLGKAEGLYLYVDNYRCLTDGTKVERLLDNITVDEVTYTADEYDILQIEYMTDKKEIFYLLTANKVDEGERFFLWHYNYDTKESGLMSTFEDRPFLYSSENSLFVKTKDEVTHKEVEGILYDGDLNYVQDGLEDYTFSNGVLYAYKHEPFCESEFEWWKNGQFYSVPINGGTTVIEGKYAYLFNNHSVYAIDLNTGEYEQTILNQGEYFAESYLGNTTTVEEKVYFITYTTETVSENQNSPLKTGCALWGAHGLKAERMYTFPKKYQVDFSYDCNEQYLNFDMYYMPIKWFHKNWKRKYKMAYYHLEKNRFVNNLKKKIVEPIEILRIGEYQFYTDYQAYGDWIFPSYCYYLHRIKDGQDEILQYYFTDENENLLNIVLFDDIHVK